jgi:hypothetical protein
MEFTEKYISTAEKLIDKDSKKVVLSDDSFAYCELIDLLIKKIEQVRVDTLMKNE